MGVASRTPPAPIENPEYRLGKGQLVRVGAFTVYITLISPHQNVPFYFSQHMQILVQERIFLCPRYPP